MSVGLPIVVIFAVGGEVGMEGGGKKEGGGRGGREKEGGKENGEEGEEGRKGVLQRVSLLTVAKQQQSHTH